MGSHSQTIALFGANGHMGKYVLEALIRSKEPEFRVLAFVSPRSTLNLSSYGDVNAVAKRVDLNATTEDDLAACLADEKADVVISVLGGQVLAKQGLVQDAAAKAGVKRFYPSEYGMHHVPWLPGEGPYLNPVWASKIKYMDDAIRHPAVKSGQMTFTVIGCGEFYDAPAEPILCPWLETDESLVRDGYQVQCVGNPDALMDYSSCVDVANFVVATLRRPDLSENKILGFRSDHISYTEIARLLEKYSGKPARTVVTSVEQMKQYVKDPSSAPLELHRGSTFPLDFWMTLRYVQGTGKFFRPPGLLSNDLFPEVKTVTFEEYFKGFFSK